MLVVVEFACRFFGKVGLHQLVTPAKHLKPPGKKTIAIAARVRRIVLINRRIAGRFGFDNPGIMKFAETTGMMRAVTGRHRAGSDAVPARGAAPETPGAAVLLPHLIVVLLAKAAGVVRPVAVGNGTDTVIFFWHLKSLHNVPDLPF